MFPSHLLGTVLVGLALHRVMPMKARDWRLALAFGVAIDLDHVLKAPAFIVENGWAAVMAPATMLQWGAEWQGFMHTPATAVVLVAGAALAFRSPIPVMFWALHMFQDFVIAKHYVRFGSVEEWLIVAGLAAVTGLVLARDHAEATRDGRKTPFLRHVAVKLGLARAPAVNSA